MIWPSNCRQIWGNRVTVPPATTFLVWAPPLCAPAAVRTFWESGDALGCMTKSCLQGSHSPSLAVLCPGSHLAFVSSLAGALLGQGHILLSTTWLVLTRCRTYGKQGCHMARSMGSRAPLPGFQFQIYHLHAL